MRRQAYTPDSLGKLEDRVVLSQAALSGVPVVVSGYSLEAGIGMVRRDFELFATGEDTPHNFGRLRGMLAQNSVGVPYHRVANLGMKTNVILDQMQADIASGAPQPIQTAYHQVVAGIRAQVQASVDNGSIVVR